jgi:Nucleotidyl transferase AbiEii toxin, Type IV TA system
MPESFEPKKDVLPEAQKQIWPLLGPARSLSFVLYGGTAVALYFGHRQSVDFDFFKSEPLPKRELSNQFSFVNDAETLQEEENALVIRAVMPAGPVKVSFFGDMNIGRVNDPLATADSVLLVASREDLLATKLKAILDRAEAKDYLDIAALLSAEVSLERGLGAFTAIFKQDPVLPLRAIGFFKDGDLPALPAEVQSFLRDRRDRVKSIPAVAIKSGSLAG